MTSAPTATAALVIASDSSVEAELVRSVLEDEFANITLRLIEDTGPDDERQPWPDVLILAFRQLEAAEHCYLGWYRRGLAEPRRHWTILLCTKEEVQRAYELCRRQLFDDYVLFWPVTLDVKRLSMAVHRGVASVTAQPERGPLAQVQPRVLVVDDDSSQLKLTGRMLEAAGYQLQYAAGGADALRLLSGTRPDIVLLDLQMPDMSGMEVLKNLKSTPSLQAIPVILVTGDGARDTVQSSRDLGATDFIVKPFKRETLLTKVSNALQRR